MPPEAPGKYLRRGSRRSCSRHRHPEEPRRGPGTCTSGSRARTKPPPRSTRPAEPCSGTRWRSDSGRMAVFADPKAPQFSVWQPAPHRGASGRQRTGQRQFQRSPQPRSRGGQGVLRRRFRLGGAPHGHVDTPRLRRPPQKVHPGTRARKQDEIGGPARFEKSPQRSPETEADTPPHWGLTFGVADADAIADRPSSSAARDHAPDRRPVVPRDGDQRPRGAAFTRKFMPENKDLGAPADSAATSS